MKMQYTEEQIARANQTDLVSFLNEQGEQLVKSGREYRWKKHDSVTVSGNRWYRHSQNKGGYPVDFVMEFYNATFPEAVKMLTGEEGEGRNSTCPAPSPDFRLPEKEEKNDRIIRYLTENRGIEKNMVEKWIGSGDIYEEKKHHNVVFVGRDADGIPRYAHCRGTGEIKYRHLGKVAAVLVKCRGNAAFLALLHCPGCLKFFLDGLIVIAHSTKNRGIKLLDVHTHSVQKPGSYTVRLS